jgi:hypothetical protein
VAHVKAYRKIQTRPDVQVLDRALGYVQEAMEEHTGALTFIPWLDGILLENKSLGVAATDIRHGLVDDRGKPRLLRGWWPTRIRGDAFIAESPTQSDLTRVLSLTASAAVVADIWVF